MSRPNRQQPTGAARQVEFPPFGDQPLRREWLVRARALATLDQAVSTLLAFREANAGRALTDKDALWIEARLEERAAVLRFEEWTNSEIRTRTLTGEAIDEVLGSFEREAVNADGGGLERLAAALRLRYKPPIMPTGPYLRLEAHLSELLMKRRSPDWFAPSLAELRSRRGVVVHKEGLRAVSAFE
jgi:methane monooxygenase component A gamma chain